jgi:hypothetical protein
MSWGLAIKPRVILYPILMIFLACLTPTMVSSTVMPLNDSYLPHSSGILVIGEGAKTLGPIQHGQEVLVMAEYLRLKQFE